MTTYIDLTNQVLRRFGSQTISSANFTSTTDPVVVLAKNAVNDAIQELNFYEFGWAFLNTSASVVTTAGQQSYAIPSSARSIDWDSFIIQGSSAASVDTTKLQELSYSEWINTLAERDGDAGASDYDTPQFVFRYPDGNIGFSPIPDTAYTIQYRYNAYSATLSAAADEPAIPSAYSSVIVAGACKYMARHRGNDQQAQTYEAQFKEGVSRMRTILINRPVRVRDSRIVRPRRGSRGFVKLG